MTIDGSTYGLEPPFMVHRDAEPDRVRGHVPAARGAARPLHDAALARLSAARRGGADARGADDASRRSSRCEPVASAADVLAAIAEARAIFVEESLNRYVVAVLRHTRTTARLALGASPRAGIALLRVAKARALADGRDYVLPDDVKAVAVPVLAHRVDPRRRRRARPGSPRARSCRKRSSRRRCPFDPGQMTSRGQAHPRPRRPHLPRRVAVRRDRRSTRPRRASCSRRSAHGPGCGSPTGPIRIRGAPAAARCSRATTSGCTLEARPAARVPLPGLAVRGARWLGSARRRCQLRLDGRAYRGTYVVEHVARGRYAVEHAEAAIEDPFGLARAEVELAHRRLARRLSAARRSSTGSSPRAARTPRTAGGCCCGARPASTSTPSASTSGASRCARCTGRRRRAAAS